MNKKIEIKPWFKITLEYDGFSAKTRLTTSTGEDYMELSFEEIKKVRELSEEIWFENIEKFHDGNCDYYMRFLPEIDK